MSSTRKKKRNKNKKKLILIPLIIFILIVIYSCNAKIIERRSVSSRVIEDVLKVTLKLSGWKDFNKTSSAFDEQLGKSAEPYIFPEDIELSSVVTKEAIDGMNIYTFKKNNNGAFAKKHILYLHGGAYVYGIMEGHIKYADKIVNNIDSVVHMPDYPLAPYSTYNEAYEKVLKLYKDILKKTSAENIIIMGDSAGGGFSLGLAMSIKERGLPKPKQLVLFSPWLDLGMSNPNITNELKKSDPMLDPDILRYVGNYWAGDTDIKNYMLSPIYGDLSNLPHITIFTGTREIFLPDTRLFRDKLKKENIDFKYYEYENMIHAFPLFDMPESKNVFKKVINTIKI